MLSVFDPCKRIKNWAIYSLSTLKNGSGDQKVAISSHRSLTKYPFMLWQLMVFKNVFSWQTAPPAMPGPAGMMNVTGQVNQGHSGQMSSIGQQPTVVSYM